MKKNKSKKDTWNKKIIQGNQSKRKVKEISMWLKEKTRKLKNVHKSSSKGHEKKNLRKSKKRHKKHHKDMKVQVNSQKVHKTQGKYIKVRKLDWRLLNALEKSPAPWQQKFQVKNLYSFLTFL